MPWCPICKTEYRDGFTKCADCHTPLTAQKPVDGDAVRTDSISEPVVIYTAANTLDADMICEMLRNADIYAATQNTSMGALSKTYTGSSLFGTQILVGREHAEAARELLQTWAAQDTRAPVSEEALSRIAMSDCPETLIISEDELARQAEAAPPAQVQHTRASVAVCATVLVLVLLTVLSFLVRWLTA